MVLMLPLSLAMENGEFDKDGGGGSSGSPVATAAAAAAAMMVEDNRDSVQWRRWPRRSMAVAAFGGIQKQGQSPTVVA